MADAYAAGIGTRRDPRKAVAYYGQAATLGEPLAAYNPGLAYLRGEGVAKTARAARVWLRRAVEGGVRPERADGDVKPLLGR